MYFLKFALKYQKRIIILASFVGILAGSANASIIALVHNALKSEWNSTLPPGLMFVLLVTVGFTLNLLSVYLLHSIAQKKLCDLRISASRQILEMQYEQVEATGRANLLASLTQDIDRICNAIEQLPTLLINGATILGCLAYMGYLSIEVFLLNMGFLGIGALFYWYPLGMVEKRLISIRYGWDKLILYFDSLVLGIKELLMHKKRRKVFLQDCLIHSSKELRDNTIKVKLIQNLVYGWGDLLYMVGLGLVLFIATPMLGLDGDTLTGYILAALFLIPPLTSILLFGPKFGDFKVATMKMEQMGFSLNEATILKYHPAQPGLKDQQTSFQSLEFREVNYHYNNRDKVKGFKIGPINLQFKSGELCFLIGGNGSGKTTLLKLMCGLYPAESGEILLNGKEVVLEELEFYRQHFSVVFTDFFLFDRLFGIFKMCNENRVQELLIRLKLDHKVSIENGRFSTLELSQGQRKRLALLVAYLEDRPFYLFDEWAATQDYEFKKIFYNEILPDLTSRGKTVVVITHDEQYFHLAQRTVKIHEGRLIEDIKS